MFLSFIFNKHEHEHVTVINYPFLQYVIKGLNEKSSTILISAIDMIFNLVHSRNPFNSTVWRKGKIILPF